MWDEKLTITDAQGAPEGERILQLNGPITISTLFDLRDTVRAEKTAKTVILDFSQVPYVDSAGVGAIVNAHVSCLNSGRTLLLVAVQDRIKNLMKNTRVDEILTIFATLHEAQAAASTKKATSAPN
jgi:anti-sigma B factor antagonist